MKMFVAFTTSARCINRNIMECKEYSPVKDIELCKVLIETLWNVKNYFTDNETMEKGINRNIMECKV